MSASRDIGAVKKELLKQAIAHLERELETLSRAADEARGEATHSESKQESKYDTRGLEASYLAHGQSKRALEVHETIGKLKLLPMDELQDDAPIRVGALVTLECAGTESRVLILPFVGGLTLRAGTLEASAVSTTSPMGQELIGKQAGDEATIKGRLYSIESVA